MDMEARAAELMALHKDELARMVAALEAQLATSDDGAKHEAEFAEVQAEVAAQPDVA